MLFPRFSHDLVWASLQTMAFSVFKRFMFVFSIHSEEGNGCHWPGACSETSAVVLS